MHYEWYTLNKHVKKCIDLTYACNMAQFVVLLYAFHSRIHLTFIHYRLFKSINYSRNGQVAGVKAMYHPS